MSIGAQLHLRHSHFLKLFGIAFLTASFLAGAAARASQDLEKQATAAYRAGDFARSADLFVQAIKAGNSDPIMAYNAACSLALSGQYDAAMTQLHAAIVAGFFNTDQMQRDPDLEALRTREGWNRLLEEAGEARKRDEKRWNTDAFASEYRPTLSEAEKQAGLALIWAEARYGFANFDISPEALNWSERYIEFIPQVSAARTTIEYYWLLKAFIAGLHDGHSSVQFPPEVWRRLYGRPPIRTERIDEVVVITRVLDPSLPVRVGEVIRTIDGQPVDSYADSRVAPYVSASTSQDRNVRIYDYDLLLGPVDQSLTLGLVDAEGGSRTVSLSRRGRDSTGEKASSSSNRSALPFDLRWHPNDIAYVQLKSFMSMETADLWHRYYDEIRERAHGIIFDVRDNGGGNSGVGYAILADLIDQATDTSSQELTVYRPTLRAWGLGQRRDPLQISSVAPSGRPHYRGPVAVLIGPRTYSAAEDFAVAFDMAARGTLIGMPTGGSTGQPVSFPLPGGGRAQVCSKRDRYADGREFVGVGVQPDIEVRKTIESIRAGTDPVLERGLEWVQQHAQSASRDN